MEVVKALVNEWLSHYPDPLLLHTDGGTHFRNDLLKELTQMLDIEHHITLAYCPWANGSVEVVGKDLVYTTRALLSELQFTVDE